LKSVWVQELPPPQLLALDNGKPGDVRSVLPLGPYDLLQLFLDSYRYDGDRQVFGAVIVQRARRQAEVIRDLAEAGDPAANALLPIADRLEQAASYVEALPPDFWTTINPF
jgi:hypothetical protein